MRKKICQSEKSTDPELDISSMIDVSFLLLIFFLVTSSLMKLEGELGLALPGPGIGGDPSVALDLSIDADGSIEIGGEEFAGPSDGSSAGRIEEVRQHLEYHKGIVNLQGEVASVCVSANDGASTQRFIDVLDAIDSAGIHSISIKDYIAAN